MSDQATQPSTAHNPRVVVELEWEEQARWQNPNGVWTDWFEPRLWIRKQVPQGAAVEVRRRTRAVGPGLWAAVTPAESAVA